MVEKWSIPYPAYTGEEPRNVYVYLPDGMDGRERLPVLYMFDGHNVFFDEDATYGTSWGMGAYMDETNTRMMIVAVECNHSPDNGRLSEYSPFSFDDPHLGHVTGRGQETMDWFTQELKPLIDRRYPTLPDRAHTAIGGSSMGGLMSLYAAVRYNDVFSKAACLSPSVRLCMEPLTADLRSTSLRKDTRFYLSWGELEARDQHQLVEYTHNALTVAHLQQEQGAQVYPYFQMDGRHCEADWRRQLGRCFRFLFGWA